MLSPHGVRESWDLGARYRNVTPDAVFCSDFQRTFRTAGWAFQYRNVPIREDLRLRECDYGDLNRHPCSEVDAERPHRIRTPFPGGESYTEAVERMRSFLRDLGRDYDGKMVLVVGHRATRYALEHWIEGVPLEEAVAAPWRTSRTYRLHVLPDPFEYVQRVVRLPVQVEALAREVEFLGRPYVVKPEFHQTLVSVRRLLPLLGGDETEAEARALSAIREGLERSQPAFHGFTGELRLAEDDDSYTIVAMAQVPGLEELYRSISRKLGQSLEAPVAHVTLYTAPNGRAIGLNNRKALESNTRPLTADEAEQLRRAIGWDH